MLAAAVMPAKYRRVMTPALRMNATTTIAIAPAQIVRARDVAVERGDDDVVGDAPEHDGAQHRREREHRRAGDRGRERHRVRHDEPAQGRDASPPQAAVGCVGHLRLPRLDGRSGYRPRR